MQVMSNRALKTFGTTIHALGLGKIIILPRRLKITKDTYNEFFLYPVFTPKQKLDKFQKEYHEYYFQAKQECEENIARGIVVIKFYAEVTDHCKIIPKEANKEAIKGLSYFHCLTPEDMEKIFVKETKQFSLPIVRIRKLVEPIKISPINGRTWVNLSKEYPTTGKTVLEKEEFENQRRQVIKYMKDHFSCNNK